MATSIVQLWLGYEMAARRFITTDYQGSALFKRAYAP
jgi:hypothetical protein